MILIHKVRVIDHVIELGDIRLRDDTKIFVINDWPDEVSEGGFGGAFIRCTFDEETRLAYEEIGKPFNDREIHIPLSEGHVWIMFDAADLLIDDSHTASNLESQRSISKRGGTLHRPGYQWDQREEVTIPGVINVRTKKPPGKLT